MRRLFSNPLKKTIGVLMFSTHKSFLDLTLVNRIASSFEIEPNPENQPHQVTGYLYSKVPPTPLKSPEIVAVSDPALSLLDLPPYSQLLEAHKNLKISLEALLSGSGLHPDSRPIAHNYSGYQFGQFAGQLGDGRAITIGDIVNKKGEAIELQLKGSGLTPYSRFADGRAVLRSSIREFLCSEAMHFLGIPTTRALSIVSSQDTVMRDLLYDGHPKAEKCAVVVRLAPSFVRFGSFEFGLGTKNEKQAELLATLFDFIIKHHYKQIKTEGKSREEVIIEFYREIVRRTAFLVANWQCVGFCHGVLNTDNMSILGLTIDYGPYGFLDYFDKGHICNHSDHSGRYSYENQPFICKWNLARLAESLGILGSEEKMFEILKTDYKQHYEDYYYRKMVEKLGFLGLKSPDDRELIREMEELLNLTKLDFTNFFRKLSEFDESNDEPSYPSKFARVLMDLSPPEDIFLDFFKVPITEQQLLEVKRIAEIQPQVIQMLGYNAELIAFYEKKFAVRNLFKEKNREQRHNDFIEKWVQWLGKYRKRLLEDHKTANQENNDGSSKAKNRRVLMNQVNPAFILRNYVLENAIRKAENGDYSEVVKLMEMIQTPFEEKQAKAEWGEYCAKAPKEGTKICVSCSS